jgi:hypothetical protein
MTGDLTLLGRISSLSLLLTVTFQYILLPTQQTVIFQFAVKPPAVTTIWQCRYSSNIVISLLEMSGGCEEKTVL